MRYSEINFLKAFLVTGMFFRHFPLYMSNSLRFREYGVDAINPFTASIPVTGGFISVLALSLALSKSAFSENRIYSDNEFSGSGREISSKFNRLKYLKRFAPLFIISVLAGYFSLRHMDAGTFIRHFFTYQWNTLQKPGFYILFPISLVYLFHHFYVRLNKKQSLIALFAAVPVSIFLHKYYFAHYFLFALLQYCIVFFSPGFIRNFQSFLSAAFVRASFPVITVVSYVLLIRLFQYGPGTINPDINIMQELALYSVFQFMIFSYTPFLEKNRFTVHAAEYMARRIFVIYIGHVMALSLFKNRLIINHHVLVYVSAILFTVVFVALLYIAEKYFSHVFNILKFHFKNKIVRG